ncbi:MAG: hypothetical protein QOJ16_296, partial [Acidobacteriota bacterium]|nr:hypothetical protein [Acidobacteriota bacterium]
LTSGLAVGGVLSQVDRGVLAVWPRQLRWALLRSVFFSEDRPGLPYRELLDRAPSRASAVEALVAAKDRGAAIPDGELCELIQDTGSLRSWEGAATLSPEFGRWVLDHYPGDLCDIARAALKVHPGATVPRLLERAADETRTTNAWGMHPMPILSEWAGEFGASDQILGRRLLLARAAKQFLLEGSKSSVGFHGLCIALSPALEETTIDPGGLALNLWVGRIPADCFSGIAALWDEVRDTITEIDREAWPHFTHMLWEWMPPKKVSQDSTILENEKGVMRAFAAKMLRDLAQLAQQSPGLSAGFKELAGRFGIDLSLEADATFEILYPGEAPSLEEFSTWEEERNSAARSLGREWASRNPGEVARELVRYEAEGLRIGRRGSLAPVVCKEIAETVEGPEVWAAAFLAEQTTADMLRAFLMEATTHREDLMARCLVLEPYRWLATELILKSQVPSEDLLTRALQQAEELPQIVNTLCQRGRVPIPTLRKILHHSHWTTALAAAVGEWCALPRGEVREEIRSDWRAALVRAQTEDHAATPGIQSLQYWLGVILAGDPELALEWLLGQLSEKGLRQVSAEEPIGRVVAALDRRQRLQVLKALDGKAPYGLVTLLVGQDIEIYGALLSSEPLRPLHLEPLERVPDETWIELALCALEACYEVEILAEAAFEGRHTFFGAGVEHWSRWVQAFTNLERDPRPEAKRIARLGKHLAEERVLAARAAERQMAINGFRAAAISFHP